MRVAFVGTSQLSLMTARLLIERGHEVILVDSDAARVEELSGQFDCGILHGDGSKPAVLREAAPDRTDILFCLTGNDQTNILAALIGRSLGFRRVIPRIRDPELTGLCLELGLEDTIVPDQTIARYLVDMAAGFDILELSTYIRGEARFFAFFATEQDVGTAADLSLPRDARVVCLYRDDELVLADADTAIEPGDEVIVLTHSRSLPELRKRWQPQEGNRKPGS